MTALAPERLRAHIHAEAQALCRAFDLDPTAERLEIACYMVARSFSAGAESPDRRALVVEALAGAAALRGAPPASEA